MDETVMMFENTVIETIKKSLKDMAFGDIERASKGDAKMGAFILASCFIDYLSCYYYGGDSSPSHYKGFVKKYLPMYNGNSLYHDLRSKLVHNYTEGGSYYFIDNVPDIHMKKLTNGRTMLNLENFMLDIKNAMNKYFDLLDKDRTVRMKAINRYINARILSIVPLSELLPPTSPFEE